MKKIEELGITRAPWRLFLGKPIGDDKLSRLIQAAPGKPCYTIGEIYEVQDAQMASAAPELYEALWFQCFGNTGVGNCRNCKGAELGNCKTCPLGKARAALAKASGEDFQ